MMTIEEIEQAIKEAIETKEYWAASAHDVLAAYAQGWRDFRRVDLYEAKLSGAYLSGVNLCEANLNRSNLSGANLEGSGLYKAVLRNANLMGADLSRATLRKSSLSSANLYGANLRITDLFGANLYYAEGIMRYSDKAITHYELFIIDGDPVMFKAGCKWMPLSDADVLIDTPEIRDRNKAIDLLAYMKKRHLGGK